MGIRTEGTVASGGPVHGGSRSGFSLVELVVAVIILAVGVLGLAGTTAFVVRQVAHADVVTERSAAFQTVIEDLRATPWSTITPGSRTVGAFSVAWTFVDSTIHTKTVEVVTAGPGMGRDSEEGMPRLMTNVYDTFTFLVLRP